MKVLFLLFFITFCNSLVFGQHYNSVTQGRNFGNFSGQKGAVVFDKVGNYYVTGTFSTRIKFDNIELTGNNENGYLAKYTNQGVLLWAKSIVSSTYSVTRNIVVDGQNNIYVSGEFYSDVTINQHTLNHRKPQSAIFILKLSPNGEVVYLKPFSHSSKGVRPTSFAIDLKGNLFLSGFDISGDPDKGFISKLSPEGDILWEKLLISQSSSYVSDIKLDKQGEIYITGEFMGNINFNGQNLKGTGKDIFISKIKSDGSLLWLKIALSQTKNLIDLVNPRLAIDSLKNIYVQSSLPSSVVLNVKEVAFSNNVDGSILAKYTKEGDNIWTKLLEINNLTKEKPQDLAVNNIGEIYITGTNSTNVFLGTPLPNNCIIIAKLTSTGKLIWNIFSKRVGNTIISGLTLTSNNKILIGGETQGTVILGSEVVGKSNGENWAFSAIVTDSSLIYKPNTLRGHVFDDKNLNNISDINEPRLPGYNIKVEPGPYYGMTDSLGNYEVEVDTGTYVISQQIPVQEKAFVVQTYPSASVKTHQVKFSSYNKKIENLNFGNQITKCSQLTIDIAADRRRRCFRSKTTVTYTNEGAADAQNVKIKVIYPKYVIPISSTKAWASKKDSVLLFDIGLVKAGERKSFVITDSTICGNEQIRGLSQCVKAYISPKSSCITPNQNWDESSVAVEANLTEQNQNATFTLANAGEKDMRDSTAFRLYANAALVKKGKVKLAKGSKTMFEVPMKASTLRMEADQVPSHPGESRPNASIQPPVILPSMAVPPTPIQNAYQDDADAEVSISCLNIIDSYDPNDKQVTPQGITKRHYIKAEDELQYLIRFQNTGTDTAFTVVVKDTLSQFLDISSLQVGSASHPFTYKVSGKGKPVVTFTFKNINLPDFKKNEPASHGYVKFIIAQKPNNPKGTVIKNTAHNYFDFNSPIATNETFNIIGDTIIIPAILTVVYDCGKENPTVAQAGTDINLCETDQVTLQANSPVKGSGSWRIISGQATLSDVSNPKASVTNIGYGEVILEWTITLCKKSSGSRVKINRYRIPAAPLISPQALQCQGKPLQPLTATGSNITWYADANKQQKLYTDNNYTPQINATTTFYATQTVNGCESPTSAVEVSIHPNTVVFSVHADTLVAPIATSYQWYFNGKEIKDATKQKYWVRNTGNYTLKTLTIGCEALSNSVAHTINIEKAVLKLSPNPTTDKIKIELSANETGAVKLVIYDRLGKQVQEFKTEKAYTILEKNITVLGLKPGIYYLEVQLEKTIIKQKFVKL